jgi:hypothetical protein
MVIYIYETRPHPSKKMMILRCILPRLYLDDCIYINASSGLGLWSYLIDHGVSLGLHWNGSNFTNLGCIPHILHMCFSNPVSTKEWLNFHAGYSSTQICHLCRATKNDYMMAPSRLSVSFRHNDDTFKQESLKPGPKSSSWNDWQDLKFIFSVLLA